MLWGVVKCGGWVLQTEDAKIWPVLGERVVGRQERQARQRDQQEPEDRGVKYRVLRDPAVVLNLAKPPFFRLWKGEDGNTHFLVELVRTQEVLEVLGTQEAFQDWLKGSLLSLCSELLQGLEGPGPRARACARAPGRPGENEAADPHLAFNPSPSRKWAGRVQGPGRGVASPPRLNLEARGLLLRRASSRFQAGVRARRGEGGEARRGAKSREIARGGGSGGGGGGGGGPGGELLAAAAAVGAEERVRAAEAEGQAGEPAGRAGGPRSGRPPQSAPRLQWSRPVRAVPGPERARRGGAGRPGRGRGLSGQSPRNPRPLAAATAGRAAGGALALEDAALPGPATLFSEL
ncbi:unnamed protein product [Rangifer tarandus platyrhynchus]|uniref:Uncharacterized protein n=2 Tax=Rangifer tarandus platyrhynchus TaxID=3082113 RepID=A0ACB0F8G3_RANTA|nr:unnamed protein product [Rangifer tarandus platyrhynchus]CAI9709204.1 unnamed protein product [Rangifer tarandus platyrhynchus]